MKTIQYITLARKSRTITAQTEKSGLEKLSTLCTKLQQGQLGLSVHLNLEVFWSTVVGSIVGDLQNILSKHHVDLGTEEIAAKIGELEHEINSSSRSVGR